MTRKDNYWINTDSRHFLNREYLMQAETPEIRMEDMAWTAETYLVAGNPWYAGFAEKFVGYMRRGFYSFATPIWSNYGRVRGLPISCYGCRIDDTTDSILYKNAEVGMMTKLGGGTSGYFGDIRGRGASISGGGESNGVMPFLEQFNLTMSVVSQGSVRRGAFAAYLPIDHPDIEEFLEIRGEGHAIQDLSFGVCVSDEWMEDMIAKKPKNLKIWSTVLKKRSETGYPYIFFTGNANKDKPQVYKDKGIDITHSNLCVTGNQRVVSSHGLLTARELYELGDPLTLFDNEKVVQATAMQLIEKDADVYRVTLENGMSHEVTAYHKIQISRKDVHGIEHPQTEECQNLKIGDRVAIQTNKGIFGSRSMESEAFLLGLYQSDGTQTKDTIMLDVWENDFDLLDEIQEKFNAIHYAYGCDTYQCGKVDNPTSRTRKPATFFDCSIPNGTVAKKRLASRTLKKALNFEKGYIPSWIWESDENTQWQYLRGLLYADGTVHMSKSDGNPLQISYADINKSFLEELQILFANLGLQTSIRLLRKGGETLLPDGKGGNKLYNTQDCWRLIVGNKPDGNTIEKHTGFLTRKGVVLEERDYRNNTKKYYKIQSIEYIGKEDVFCCTVDSSEHLWVCNGFITHNCTEIFLGDTYDESFVCDLSSMNADTWDEWKDTDAVRMLVLFLDTVMTEFINKTEGVRLMADARRFAIRQRALGIGMLGWHSYLQSKMIAFESMEAKLENVTLWKHIRTEAEAASRELAEVYGEPELLKGYGMRNVTLLACAPTTSSSFILGQVSPSVEPLNSNYFVKALAKGNYTWRNPHLQALLEQKEQDTDETWMSILKRGGSVQHLRFLDQHEKDVFKTFGEISQKEVVIQAAQRQKYIDQGQSINLMIGPHVSPKEINQLMIFAWEQGLKSLYYQRSTNPSQELARKITTCVSCEA